MAAAQKTRGVAGGRKRIRRDVLSVARFDIRSVNKVFKQIPVDQMKPGIYQTRRNFNSKALGELQASLQATGINITPLIIRPLKHSEGYEIICGERRWRAAQAIGLTTLLCCVGDYNDEQAMYLSGADNIQREDLNPLEEAESYELMVDAGMTQQEVADEIGKSRPHVTNYLSLLKLPLPVRDFIAHGRLSFAQARPLCSRLKPGQQIDLAGKAVKNKWSSKKIEEEVAKTVADSPKRSQSPPAAGADVNLERLRDLVSEQTGYPCVIVKTARSWQLGLSASSVDEFQGILDRLGIDTERL
ncbi:ParB/RepB/Spo0J family partition protein [Pseudomonas putida]|uniref:ParB/RepB/Spo0J family partition protein n=1 Tax=Pseudomonas putida TaxID=303 RepID=UPI0023634B5D|nr:ParB/RepB/Spo0J family partition protein [Pseudomonas putida]MDD2139627.1 ParB/RepB/Spo0J family partition protein [Pseudomonas putida]HDS1721550.1 ParB/RepB/Spo0J family partition protein [Pseudomonas putida]